MCEYSDAPWSRVDTTGYHEDGERYHEHWVLNAAGDELACLENPNDADLISAAPELYLVAISVVALLGEASYIGRHEKEVLESSRVALRKARGFP